MTRKLASKETQAHYTSHTLCNKNKHRIVLLLKEEIITRTLACVPYQSEFHYEIVDNELAIWFRSELELQLKNASIQT